MNIKDVVCFGITYQESDGLDDYCDKLEYERASTEARRHYKIGAFVSIILRGNIKKILKKYALG